MNDVIHDELEKRAKFFRDNKFVPKSLADYIKEKYIFKTPIDTEKIHVYDNGLYKPNAEALIKAEVRNVLGDLRKKNYVEEVIADIRDTTHIDRELINNPVNKLLLENGVLDIETLEVEPFNPDYFFTFKIPVIYDPNAKCDLFLEWLDDVLLNEEWKKLVIQEWFGYHLLKDNRFQKAFLLYGDRRTRKSTLLKVLESVCGRDNCKNFTLQKLTSDRFTIAYIYDKLANICPDLTRESLKDTGKFMMITGNDTLTARFLYGHPFSFEPITKLTFSCNIVPPSIYNKTLAFYRRWMLIKFENIIDESEVNIDYENPPTSPLMTSEMLSGIFNWALEGLKRLLKDGKFSYPFDEYYVKDVYEKESDSINSYIYTCIVEGDYTNRKTKREVFKDYLNWCEENKIQVENQIKFGRWFRAITGCGVGHINRIPCYVGIRFKRELKEVQEIL